MDIEKFQDKWLFQDHTKSEIKNWVSQLHYFYFVRALGGHNDDGDRFLVAFSYSSKENIIDTLSKLGVQINILPPHTPRPIAGVSYPAAEFWKFKISVRCFPGLEQPGKTKINSFPCHIYINDTKINISISGTKDDNFYAVTTKDFEVCKELEIFFDKLSLSDDKNYEIEKDAACVSRVKYPELFDWQTTVPNNKGFNIQHWTEMPAGGHFAAMEQPSLLAKDITDFFKALA